MKVTRRQSWGIAGAMAFGGGGEAAERAGGSLRRISLELGHRGTRGGPVAVLPDGSLGWVTTEPEAPYLSRTMWQISRLVLRRSRDGGQSWGEPQTLAQGTREYSLLSHVLRPVKGGALLHVFVRYSGYDYDTARPEKSLCEAFCQRSTDNGRTWGAAAKLATGERYIGDVLSMEETRGGRLVYPFAFLTSKEGQFAVSALWSDDGGKTWSRSRSVLEAGGSGFESGASEPTVIELANGRLLMLIRAQSGFLWRSYSEDRGESWSAAEPSRLPSSNSPATALRLRSGKLAIAWNNHVDGNYARQSLVLGMTSDGESFEYMREIDGTDFPDHPAEPIQHATYAYLAELRDGTIAVSYNKGTWMRYNRPLLALASPAWLTATAETIDFTEGRTGWHTVNPGPNRRAAVERYAPPEDSHPGASLEIEQAKGITEAAGISRSVLLIRDGNLRLAVTVVKPEAHILLHDTLLTPGATEEAVLRIRFAQGGGIYVAVGEPARVDRDRRSTKFSYLRHAIGTERKHPSVFTEGRRMMLSVRYLSATGTAVVRIDDGPPMEVKTAPILGLSNIGLAVKAGGVLRVRSIEAARG